MTNKDNTGTTPTGSPTTNRSDARVDAVEHSRTSGESFSRVTTGMVHKQLVKKGIYPTDLTNGHVEQAWLDLKEQDPNWTPKYRTSLNGAGCMNGLRQDRVEAIAESYTTAVYAEIGKAVMQKRRELFAQGVPWKETRER